MVTMQDSENLNPYSPLGVLVKDLCSSFNLSSFSERKILRYTEKKSKLLRFLLTEGYVKSSDIELFVHDTLIKLGEVTFTEHVQTRTAPDHCGNSHQALGYAMKHGGVPIPAVKFDHGETADEYIASAEGLLEAVVEQLLSYVEPPPLIKSDWSGDHIWCSH